MACAWYYGDARHLAAIFGRAEWFCGAGTRLGSSPL